MPTVGLAEAKSKLSELVDQVERGEEVVISRNGKAVARIVPIERQRKTDRSAFLGSLAGKIHLADGLDDPLPPAVQRSFEGSDETSGG